MDKPPKPRGRCTRCNKDFPSSGMGRHLPACIGAGDGLHLVVTGGRGMWWMHLALAPGATFAHLDSFLRGTWLECCGHMSGFRAGQLRHGGELPTSAPVARLLEPGARFVHEYDYGSTTRLEVRVAGPIAAGKDAVTLLARNDAIPWPCEVCETALATVICPQCFAMACDACGDPCGHLDEDYPGLPVMNSPRMGVCGYGG